MAGSLEGGLRPDGRMFSSCDAGRSMVTIFFIGSCETFENPDCCKSTNVNIQAMA